ncbi:hypothetical protein [Lysobacter gummosus]|uniref:hypothetical protein n=1 Tax=Lysobacter gummosus TaxID=262324 RepID=UPI0036330D07
MHSWHCSRVAAGSAADGLRERVVIVSHETISKAQCSMNRPTSQSGPAGTAPSDPEQAGPGPTAPPSAPPRAAARPGTRSWTWTTSCPIACRCCRTGSAVRSRGSIPSVTP